MATLTPIPTGGNLGSASNWVGGVKPTAADDVVIDSSVTADVTINLDMVCRSFNCTGFTHTLTQNSNLTIGDGTAGLGNVALKLVSSMSFVHTSGFFVFVSTSATQQSVDCAGNTAGTINFNGTGGSWILTGSPPVQASSDNFLVSQGTVNTGGLAIVTGKLEVDSGTTFNMNNSTVTCAKSSGTALQVSAGSTFTATGSTLKITGASPQVSTGSKTLNNVEFTGTGTVAASPTNATGYVTVNGPSAVSLASDWSVAGLLTIGPTACAFQSSTPGSQHTVALGTTGTATLSNVTFTDIKFTGTYTPVGGPGLGLVDGGDNSGINFGTPSLENEQAILVKWSSATLTGNINPQGQATTYYFEYGTTTGYGTSIPAGHNGNAGNGSDYVLVGEPISGLTPATPYHFRLVAANSNGTTTGSDHTFTTTVGPTIKVFNGTSWNNATISVVGP